MRRCPTSIPRLATLQVLEGFDATGKPQLRPVRRPISLRHLLTHTSGFCYPLWDAKVGRYAKARSAMSPAERSRLPPKPLMFDPGERWQYGSGIDWVGRLVELVSEEPLDEYFRRHICEPLGMKDTTFLLTPSQLERQASVHRRNANGLWEPQPHERQILRRPLSGGGGIDSTAPDYLAFLRMLLRGGTRDGVRILRAETVGLMGQNQIGDIDVGVLRTTAPLLSNDVDLLPGIKRKWGFGHMINLQPSPNGRSAGSLTWGGLLNTYYWMDPRHGVAAVFMTQVLPFADGHALRAYREFERGVYAALKTG